MKVATVFLNAFVAAALGVPMEHVLHEKRGVSSITKREALPAEQTVPVRIALKQTNLEKGMDLLIDVSDPDSANYGNHYTQEQVQAMFAPDDHSVVAVKRWLVDVGIPEASITTPRSQGWLDFRTTVGKLEGMLKTRYHVYQSRSGSESFGTDEYHLPADISPHVDFIQPAVATVDVKRADKPIISQSMIAIKEPVTLNPSFAASGCDTKVTPACIRDTYGIPQSTSKIAGNELGMFESGGEYSRQSDLNLFYSSYATNIPQGFGPKEYFIDFNGNNPDGSQAGGEAALDFDMALPIIYPQSSVLYQTNSNFDGQSHLGFLNQFLDAVDGTYCTSGGGDDPNVDGTTPNEACGKFTPAHVISFSYGLSEKNWPVNYQKRQCDEFMKLGLLGSSIVFASGDGGVAGGHGGDCAGDGTVFNPASPASCPYITSVGSTQLTASAAGSAESATSRFSGGGGFSNIWAQPSYQSSSVSSYFSKHDPGFKYFSTSDGKIPNNSGVYNRGGRGFPDVAALGDYGVVVLDGGVFTIGGTSMACPIFASVLNRINEERLKAGKKVIGFANPAMYKNPAMFRDVTLGKQGGGNGACNGKAFSATAGWDPVTGLGTPKYADMVKYFNSLA